MKKLLMFSMLLIVILSSCGKTDINEISKTIKNNSTNNKVDSLSVVIQPMYIVRNYKVKLIDNIVSFSVTSKEDPGSNNPRYHINDTVYVDIKLKEIKQDISLNKAIITSLH